METTVDDWQKYFDWKELPDIVPTGLTEMQFPHEDMATFPLHPFGAPEVTEDVPLPDLEFDLPQNDLCLPQIENGLDIGRTNAGNDEILRRLDDISARLTRLESTVTTTANDMEGVLHTARGALQNLIDLAEGFYDSIEKLKNCMGMFTKGLVEHFFGDDGTLEVEV
ncbi:hypothetical protein LZ32DRAFT_692389 [Colletotrichum eremochloae]|nr:hypothetical protein LZ32DRAFT_692389 [Colletotrichum eremochloae]